MEYINNGLVTEFMYSSALSRVFRREERLSSLKKFSLRKEFLTPDRALVFVENPATERMSLLNATESVLTYRDRKPYLMAIAFTLATQFGVVRLMSGFQFSSAEQGPPANEAGDLISPTFDGHRQCNNGYMCQHRWPEIVNMVQFRRVTQASVIGGPHNWADNGADQVAFCVNQGGFIAFNGYNTANFDAKLRVCLPEGVYCDVISGEVSQAGCTGEEVIVNKTGYAHIFIPVNHKTGMIAIHSGARMM